LDAGACSLAVVNTVEVVVLVTVVETNTPVVGMAVTPPLKPAVPGTKVPVEVVIIAVFNTDVVDVVVDMVKKKQSPDSKSSKKFPNAASVTTKPRNEPPTRVKTKGASMKNFKTGFNRFQQVSERRTVLKLPKNKIQASPNTPNPKGSGPQKNRKKIHTRQV